jgi:ATP-dependent exoDNAse (exonuclease V) beta subunit
MNQSVRIHARLESQPAPPVLVLENPVDAKQTAEELRAAEAEALCAALRMAVSEKGWSVWDAAKKAHRQADYRDCAWLFPTTTGLEIYTECLKRYGIPFSVESGKRFFSTVPC